MYMYIYSCEYMYLCIYLPNCHWLHWHSTAPPNHLVRPPATRAYFNLSAAWKLLFCAFCQMNFPRRSQDLFEICLQQQRLFRWFIRIMCAFFCILSLSLFSLSLLPPGTKILISSPTNFVIARCERALNLNWIFAHIKMHLHRVSYECIWEKRHSQ